MSSRHDTWTLSESYETYMGRWSRQIAGEFVAWLAAPLDRDWLEIGCGTGALTEAVLAQASLRSLLATDLSDEFLRDTASRITDPRVTFRTAGAETLPARADSVDVAVSGLVLNFLYDRRTALREARRVLRSGGLLGFYVWDYPGGGMRMLSAFWRAAIACDPAAIDLGEQRRFPFCTRHDLTALCLEVGFAGVEVSALETRTEFADFEELWHPFTLGAGPAPGYVRSLDPERREALRLAFAAEVGANGPIILPARAWAVRAIAPPA